MASARFGPRLVMLAKEPRIGRVKTRLAKGLGAVPATKFYRDLMRQLPGRLDDPRWQTMVALSPDRALGAAHSWFGAVRAMPQGAGDLGARMGRLFADLPPGPVVIIGSDIPAIERHHIAAAFRALGRADAVLGPAEDGGYWLIGLRRFPRIPFIFENIRWSSEHALADTARNLDRLALRTILLERLRDIDTAEDHARLRNRA